MATQKKIVNVKEFYSVNLEAYLANLHKINPEAHTPVIVKPNITAATALNAVEEIIKDHKQSDKRFNKKIIKAITKKGCKPVVKRVYQNVLLTFFKTSQAEYDYSYYLKGDTINMSPERITINEGYAEFTSATQCFVGDTANEDQSSYPWAQVTDDMLTETVEPDYVIANLTNADIEKDSKESMRQYNAQLNDWLRSYQQQKLGKARTISNVTIYDKEYDYNDMIMLAPFILVSYDLGKMIITFSVNALTGNVNNMLLNNPTGKFEYDPEAATPPNFSVLIFIVASVCVVVIGGVVYLINYLLRKATFGSKTVNGYTTEELRKLL